MIRSTTNGVLKSYQYNLQRSTYTLNKARDTVLTGRSFNSFAEDPALAAHSFKLRTSLLRVDSQYGVGESVVRKYDVAWSSLNSVTDDLRAAKSSILTGKNPPTASGRNALGQELTQLAEGIVKTMNAKYGDNFVFAGADGLNVPFDFKDGKLSYRGIDLNTNDPDELKKLEDLLKNEKKFADLGLGMKETATGELIESSAFDVSLHGASFLGYGQDKDGDPQNIVCMINRMGEILKNCDKDGNFRGGEEEEYNRLAGKFETAMSSFTSKHTELDARTGFLKDNQKQLRNTAYSMQEQIVAMERVEPADAIISYSWAQYCYNSALKVGNSILSQSLMDYMRG